MSAELNQYEAVFYNKRSRMEYERVSGIGAMNPAEAERIAWHIFDDRHANETFVTRDYYSISVKGPGQ